MDKSQSNQKLFPMSKLIDFLIKIRFIPILKTNYNEKKRLMWSFWRTVTYIIIYYGMLFMIWGLRVFVFRAAFKELMLMLAKTNIMDKISIIVYQISIYMDLPFCPILFAIGISSIPSLASSRCLNWPKNGTSCLIAFFLFSAGNILTNICVNLQHFPGNFTYTYPNIIPFYILPSLDTFIVASCWIIPSLVFSSLLDNFLGNVENIDGKNLESHVRMCLNLYFQIEKGFGPFLLLVFGFSQFFLLFTLFLSISKLVLDDDTMSNRFLYFGASLTFSSGLILNIISLTLTIDKTYTAVKKLYKPLQNSLVDEESKNGSGNKI